MTTDKETKHGQLYRNVREAIACLPLYFRTETHIEGIVATDLHRVLPFFIPPIYLYLPFQTGSRFSANARAPSRWSSLS